MEGVAGRKHSESWALLLTCEGLKQFLPIILELKSLYRSWFNVKILVSLLK